MSVCIQVCVTGGVDGTPVVKPAGGPLYHVFI